MKLVQEGFQEFSKGTFGNAGANLFVDAKGAVRRISEQDLNGDGCFDIVFPNSHGYIERGKTEIFHRENGIWKGTELPHDSCWRPRAVDIDGDGYPDLLIANAENGVTSDLTSYLYWGGKDGLTGERCEFETNGAYDVTAVDLTGNGLKDLIFTSAWHDHHYPGADYDQMVFVQDSPRSFHDATQEFKFTQNTIMSLGAGDLTGNGYDDLVMAGYKGEGSQENEFHIYYGGPEGLSKDCVSFRSRLVTNLYLTDVFGTGRKDIVLTGGNRVVIWHNMNGTFSEDHKTEINVEGAMTQFLSGSVGCDIADIDGDGIQEFIIGTAGGLQIRKASEPDKVWQKAEGYYVSDVKACDFDGRGKMDIVATVYSNVKTYDVDSYILHEHDGKWDFEHVTPIPTHGAMHVAVADLDNDGQQEIIVCNTMGGPNQGDPEFPVFCYYGNPTNVFSVKDRVEYPVNCGAYSYVAADVDNDGYVELITTIWDGARIFKGGPDGPDPKNYYDVFDPCHRITGGIILADITHNGWLDMILTTGYSPSQANNGLDGLPSTVTLFYGGPEGYCQEKSVRLPLQLGAAQALVLADLDGNGLLDLIAGDIRGDIHMIRGTKDGLPADRAPEYIKLKNSNGAELMGVTAADVDGDGKLEVITTSCGHYTKKKSYLNILRDPEHGYPEEKQTSIDVGGTTGYVTLADLRHTGCLDMVVPFYSTSETRVLPMRIFNNDGKGNFDFDHPQKIQCESSIASLAVDLNRNGYPDLLVCCHRNDLGHTVQSMLFMNGPEGLDFEHPQKLWAYGPHDFTRNCIFNMVDRTETEWYTSAVLKLSEQPESFHWTAECPSDTRLSFRIRSAETEEALEQAPWGETIENGGDPKVPAGHKFLQYRAGFFAPNAIGSPRLTRVEIG